jgi:hypothetical protein
MVFTLQSSQLPLSQTPTIRKLAPERGIPPSTIDSHERGERDLGKITTKKVRIIGFILS